MIVIASIAIVSLGLIIRLNPDHQVDSFFSWFLFFEWAIYNYYEFRCKAHDRFATLGITSVILTGWLLYFHFSVLGL